MAVSNDPIFEGSPQALDINGWNQLGPCAATIYQDVATTPGATYSYTLGDTANTGGPPYPKTFDVYWGPPNALVKVASYQVPDTTKWTANALTVTATSTTSRLQIVSTTDPSSSWGPFICFLDNPIALTTKKTTYKRDEIFDLTLTGPTILTTDQVFEISLINGTTTATLGSRGPVLMYDVGNGVKSFTQKSDGTAIQPPYLVTLKAGENTVHLKAVVNLEQDGVQFQIKDHTLIPSGVTYRVATTPPLSFKKQIRQFAEKEDPQNTNVNSYDDSFINAASLWPNWGYGDANGTYAFDRAATFYTAELLKTLCFKETQMNASIAAQNSVPTDIMQVDGGTSTTDVLNGVSEQKDWNNNATPVLTKNNVQYYLVDEDTGIVPVNTAAVILRYLNNPPGPASVSTEALSIQWAVRELLYKQTKLHIKTLEVKGQGKTLFATYPKIIRWLKR